MISNHLSSSRRPRGVPPILLRRVSPMATRRRVSLVPLPLHSMSGLLRRATECKSDAYSRIHLPVLVGIPSDISDDHTHSPVVLHTDHCAKKLLPWFDGMIEADAAYFNGVALFRCVTVTLCHMLAYITRQFTCWTCPRSPRRRTLLFAKSILRNWHL